MKAIILAAGRGTRLGKLTEDKPKCMLKFGNETILEYQIRILQDSGIERHDIIVVTGYKKECVGVIPEICFINNLKYDMTDNSYSLFLALSNVMEDVLVLDGDLIFTKEAIETLTATAGNVLLGNLDNNQYGATGVEYTEAMRVTAIGKHISSDVIYSSIMKIDCASIDHFRDELGQIENLKTWYTLPLNHLLSNMELILKMSPTPVMGVNSYFDYIEVKKAFGIEDYSILVTGASGFLGKKIYHILKRDYNVRGVKGVHSGMNVPSVDITDKAAIGAYIEFTRPSVIIHAAGIADPDVCEEDHDKAYEVNVKATAIITEICKSKNIKLIFVSTDYVFSGDAIMEYEYHATREPKNYYGKSKCMAEDIVRSYDNSLIVRIPIIYGYNDEMDKETFPTMVIRNLKNNQSLLLDNKQVRYPVLIDDVAIAISQSLAKSGIIHVTSSQPVTKYTWAKVIAGEYKYQEDLIQENKESLLINRPRHIKLQVTDRDYKALDITNGTHVLKSQQHCAFRLIYKSAPQENVYGKRVGEYRFKLGQSLGRSLPTEVVGQLDYVMPVPTSGLYYAMGMSESVQIPYMQGLVKPDSSVRSFQIADITLREQTIRDKIFAVEELIRGKNIALVDEAIFTGTTLRVICDMVKACGANKIYICIPTPICRNKCAQYVQPDRELLSHFVDISELKNYFGVDEVFFQPYNYFEASLKEISNVCFDCFRTDI